MVLQIGETIVFGVIFQAHEVNGTVTTEYETTVCYGQLHDFQ
jgi:hypothetical protein